MSDDALLELRVLRTPAPVGHPGATSRVAATYHDEHRRCEYHDIFAEGSECGRPPSSRRRRFGAPVDQLRRHRSSESHARSHHRQLALRGQSDLDEAARPHHPMKA